MHPRAMHRKAVLGRPLHSALTLGSGRAATFSVSAILLPGRLLSPLWLIFQWERVGLAAYGLSDLHCVPLAIDPGRDTHAPERVC